MDEDWDDDIPMTTTTNQDSYDNIDSGRHMGKGRGFVPPPDDDEMSCNGTNGNRREGRGGGRGNRGGYSGRDGGGRRFDNDNDDESTGRRGGFRGRGGGRGGGNRGSRNFNSDDGERSSQDGYQRRGGGDRGSSSRGRGGGSRRFDENGDGGDGYKSKGDGDKKENGEPEKPREIYIPPEPTDDEETLFGGAISSGINFSKYDNIQTKITGDNAPKPITCFEQSGMRKFVLDIVKKSGYTKPTPVQKYAIPSIIAGRDLMACAQTGSGKTAAFLLPIINQLLQNPAEVVSGSHTEPHVVILSPVRELAMQIYTEARKFSHSSIIKCGVAYGGTAVQHQAQKLLNGCHIIVATPGRLNDYVSRGKITFNSIRYFVLDEADRMLDMGFLSDIEKMLNHPTMVQTGERQTLMFSATFPEDIQRLAYKFLNNYLFLTVGVVGGACADVEQRFYQVARFDKRNKLSDLLSEEGDEKTLVFVETKRNADFIAIFLSEKAFPATSIHGDRLQREREEALADFKSGRKGVLVATAVAARGLDIKGVNHVINYDLPKSIDEYVHRIGRTGRVGNRGKATSFYDNDQDSAIAGDLVKILQQAEQEVPTWLNSDGGGGSGGYSRDSFGGSDVRKFPNKNEDMWGNEGQPQAIEEEENWM